MATIGTSILPVMSPPMTRTWQSKNLAALMNFFQQTSEPWISVAKKSLNSLMPRSCGTPDPELVAKSRERRIEPVKSGVAEQGREARQTLLGRRLGSWEKGAKRPNRLAGGDRPAGRGNLDLAGRQPAGDEAATVRVASAGAVHDPGRLGRNVHGPAIEADD